MGGHDPEGVVLDPSLTALLDHLNWSPPAIVQPAPTDATGHQMSAYAAYVTRQEEQVSAWITAGVELREIFWESGIERKPGFDIGNLSNIIEQFENGLKREAFVLARKQKEARRAERDLDGTLKAFVERQHARMLQAARVFYTEGRDFAAFLRALRAEIDPTSQGGEVFEDPAALQAYLAKSLA